MAGACRWHDIGACGDDDQGRSGGLGDRPHAVIGQDVLDRLLHVLVDPLLLLVGHADAQTVGRRHVQLLDQPRRKPDDHGASFARAAQFSSARLQHFIGSQAFPAASDTTSAACLPALQDCCS